MSRTVRLSPRLALSGGAVLATVLVAGCASVNPFAEADPRWADYKSWTVANPEGSTGASPGLGSVHKGPDGFRLVYVNDTGRATLMGDGPYEYPDGTVIVKESYGSEGDYTAGKTPDVTVSLKVSDDAAAARDNWQWATGYKAAASDSAFCSGCHSIPFAKDFVFSNSEYLAAN